MNILFSHNIFFLCIFIFQCYTMFLLQVRLGYIGMYKPRKVKAPKVQAPQGQGLDIQKTFFLLVEGGVGRLQIIKFLREKTFLILSFFSKMIICRLMIKLFEYLFSIFVTNNCIPIIFGNLTCRRESDRKKLSLINQE